MYCAFPPDPTIPEGNINTVGQMPVLPFLYMGCGVGPYTEKSEEDLDTILDSTGRTSYAFELSPIPEPLERKATFGAFEY